MMKKFASLLRLFKSPNAFRETASRRRFLRRSGALAAGGLSAGLLVPGSAWADNSDDLSYHFRSIQDHENAHLAFLIKTLGTHARPAPTFHGLVMDSLGDFIAMSQMLENLETSAYLTAGAYLDSSTYLAAAGSILQIEARHASYLNLLQSDPLTGHVFDFADDEAFESTIALGKLRSTVAPFILSLNGGPPITFSSKKSAQNDIDILNTALASEYLGSTFYNTNVHRFFG